MITDGIKSKERVEEFGEVLTSEEIVNDMLDLIEDEKFKVETTFLEPSCGNGNFLVKILERKLNKAFKNNSENKDRGLFISISSIYGVDIQKDNIEQSKKRMMNVVKQMYPDVTEEMVAVVKFVLDLNIIWGDMLTGLRVDNNKDVVIVEWKIKDDIVTRKDFALNSLNSKVLQNTALHEYEDTKFTEINKVKKAVQTDLFDEL